MIVSSDLVIYASEYTPFDNSSSAGGSINSSGLRTYFDISYTGQIIAYSNTIADTGILTIYGRLSSTGTLINETIQMSGTTIVSSSNYYERISRVVLSEIAKGTITISGIGTIPLGEVGFTKAFINAESPVDGIPGQTLYEKVFYKNNNTSSTLLNAYIEEQQAGLYNIVEFSLENSLNHNESIANRLTAPTGVSVYSNSSLDVPSTNIGALQAQGIWLKMTVLPDNTSGNNSFYRLRLNGYSI